MAKEATIKININTKNAINSVEDLNNEFNGTLQTIGDLRIASQRLSEELESTPVGTKKFQDLQTALIDVNGQLKNYELSIEALDNEQLTSEIRSVVGGVMDLVGGFTLLGASEESMEKIAQKFAKIEGISRAATGAMDIYNSGIKVMNSILTKSAAAQEVLATATTASGTASAGAATKFRALTAAMLSNPLTAIAVAIGAVVSALILFGDESEEAEKKYKKFADSVSDNSRKINKSIESSLTIMGQRIKQMEIEGASEAQIFDERLKLITLEEEYRIKQYYANQKRLDDLKNQRNEDVIEERKKLEEENKALYNSLFEKINDQNEYDIQRRDLELEYLEWKKGQQDKDLEDYKKKSAEEAKIEQERIANLTNLYNQFLLEKEKVENEFYDKGLTLQELEKNAVRDKYFTLIQQAEEYEEGSSQILKDAQQEELDAIDEKYKKQAELEKSNIEKINAETKLLEIEHQKEMELLDADSIDDEETKQQAILDIKRKYLQLEIDAINEKYKKEADLLKSQLNKELSDENLTLEEKERIRAEYTSNIIQLEQDKEKTIAELEAETILSSTEKLKTKLDKYSELINQIGSYITQVTSTLDTYLAEKEAQQKDRIIDNAEQAKKSLDGRLKQGIISREEYEARLTDIENNRDNKERELAEKAFKRQKAMQIVNATIQGAQAVLAAYSSGAGVPLIGPITTGPAYAAIAAALTAAQIGVISSQKFRASKGGKVPGSPSGVDSVNALLAPGETVINSQSSQMFGPLLDMINQAGGGISLAPNAGIITPKTQTIYTDNVGVGQQVVKAYVVEQDISYSQSRVNKLRNNAKFS